MKKRFWAKFDEKYGTIHKSKNHVFYMLGKLCMFTFRFKNKYLEFYRGRYDVSFPQDVQCIKNIR